MSARAPLRLLLRVLPLVLLLLAAAPVRADPPGRVARLSHVEGSISLAPAGDNEWTEAPRNRPLTRGDRLWTDRGSRAELQVGSSALRLDGRTRLDILTLDDRSAQLSLTQGTLYARVRSLPEGENFEVNTPNLAWRAAYPGDYRIDVDPAHDTTRVTIHSGTGAVYGESGQALPLGGGQQITFRGRSLAQLAAQESPPLDGFDRWAQARNRLEDQSIAARHVPREVVGYQELDPHGQWRRDPAHGAVWLPHGMPANWAPYRHGHWDWIAPWGWTWIDDAPWGFAPFHYGRWTMVDEQWAWVPGRLGLRPVYAPALVAFLGGGTGGVTWFPLAPGEAWQPPYRASPGYLANVNRDIAMAPDAAHAHQRSREALTSIAASDFHRGRPADAGWLRVAANLLTNAQVVPPPSMPDRAALAQARAERVPIAAPAAVRQVVADAPRAAPPPTSLPSPALPAAMAPPQPPLPITRRAAAAPGGRAPAATDSIRPAPAAPQNAKTATVPKEAPRSEPVAVLREPVVARSSRAPAAPVPARTKATVQARPRASEVRQTAQAGAPERAGREVEAKRVVAAGAEEARRDKRRVAEEARREATARRAQQARHQEQLQREAVARREEQSRRQAHARQVEQARRAAERDAQAFNEQRLRRELQARRANQEREQTERAAWQRAQQATTEQWRREHDALEQRRRPRGRPDLRSDPRSDPAYRTPEVWQRGIPLLAPGRTS